MKATIDAIIPKDVIIEPIDVCHLFFRMTRQSQYVSNEALLKELLDNIVEGFDEEGYDLTIIHKWGYAR